MKSPIRLMSGLSSRAFPLAPPKVWVGVVCSACACAAGAAAAGAPDAAIVVAVLAPDDDSAFTDTGADVKTTRAPEFSPVAFASAASTFTCPRSDATSSASLLTCCSSIRIRSSEFAATFSAPALVFPALAETLVGPPCARAPATTNSETHTKKVFLMDTPLNCDLFPTTLGDD